MKFNDILRSFGLINHINFSTHIHGNTLDLVITRNTDQIDNLHSEPGPFFSDHRFCKLFLNLKKPHYEHRVITFRKLNNINIEQFKNDLENTPFLKENINTLEIDDLAVLYDDSTGSVVDKHAPLIRKKIKLKPSCPWYNASLDQLKREKRKLERKFITSKTHEDQKLFIAKRNEYNKKCNDEKTSYLTSEIENCNGDQKKLHSFIKKLTSGNKNIPYPEEEDLTLANNFGRFFKEKIENVVKSISNVMQNENIQDIVDYNNYESELQPMNKFKTFTEKDIKSIIMSMSTKSCELDRLPTPLLKLCIDLLIRPITILVNKSLSSGCFPTIWKTAIVTPLLKKSNLGKQYKNYRPVSNIPFLSKVIEKAALLSFNEQFNQSNSFLYFNSAYKPDFSTETLLTKITSDILINMDNKKLTLLVLIDLSAAFDTVDHLKLVKIIKHKFNVNEVCLSWLKSYISERKQKIKINQSFSEDFSLNYGVPQGSCLGPVIFIAYISYLYEFTANCKPSFGAFADDHQMHIAFKPSTDELLISQFHMEECILKVRKFFLSHNLLINDDKTELIVLGSQYQLNKINEIQIKVGNCSINPSTKIKNLGVIFDKNLNLNEQINNVCKKSYYQLQRINQLRKYLDQKSLISLVHAFVTSNIDYCNTIYFNIPEYMIQKIQRIQNTSARVITQTSKYEHITPTLKHLHWLPVKERIIFKIAVQVFKCLNGYAPAYLKELINMYTPPRNLRSGNKNLLAKPKINSISFGGRSFAYSAPQIWNSLSNSIKMSPSLSTFKKNLKTFLFNKHFL